MNKALDNEIRTELRDYFLRHMDLAEAAYQVEEDDVLKVDMATAMALSRHLGAKGLTVTEDGRPDTWVVVTLAEYAQILKWKREDEDEGKGAA